MCKIMNALPLKSYFGVQATHTHSQLWARRALSIFKDVPLRTRWALTLYNVYGDSALLVLNGTSLSSDRAPLALNWTGRQEECMRWFEGIVTPLNHALQNMIELAFLVLHSLLKHGQWDTLKAYVNTVPSFKNLRCIVLHTIRRSDEA